MRLAFVGAGIVVGLLLAASVSTLAVLSAASAAPYTLRWAPPTLKNPTTIKVPAYDSAYNGVTKLKLDRTRDYIIDLPDKKKVGGLSIKGGRNIHIIGGHITANPNHLTDNAAVTSGVMALRIVHNYGTVHIEGLLIDDSAGGQSDAINVTAPYSTVQIQNVRVERISGRDDQVHADLIQIGNDDVKELRVDRFTGYSNYQGLFFSRWGPTIVKNTNLAYKASPYVTDYGGGHFGWVTSSKWISSTGDFTCEHSAHTLSEVYITPKPGRSLGRSAWPRDNSTFGCEASVGDDGGYAYWPMLSKVRGGVKLGPPVGGDFVPEGVAGVDYVSPGYR